MSVFPGNIIIKENIIDIEYGGYHWCYEGRIVPLIKNHDKIVLRNDGAFNVLMLNYNDGIETFAIPLKMKISLDASENKSSTTIKSFDVSLEEIMNKANEINCKITKEKKIIDDHQKIINAHQNEIDKLDKEFNELKDQLNNSYLLVKYKCGMQLTSSERFQLISKEIITAESLIVDSTTSNINGLISNHAEQLKKLITDKKLNINTKNKEGKTLLEISLRNYEKFPIFLLDNDIDISPSVKNDIENINTIDEVNAYFNNAKRNNHLDLLVIYYGDIKNNHLKNLVKEYMESKKQ